MLLKEKARISEPEIQSGRRIIAVSDIHTNLPYLKGLLKKVNFTDEDELIIVGDFLEKGEQNLETLRYVMELQKRGNVHPLLGNCDDWFRIFSYDEEADAHVTEYIMSRKSGLLWEMLNSCGVDPFEMESLTQVKKTLLTSFEPEWRFLAALPHAIKVGRYVFAHGGVHAEKSLYDHEPHELKRYNNFLATAGSFENWVVVGHWPVMLYRENTVNANPVVDRQRHIISIDGGCMLKDDGQLNALIIPDKDSDDFSFDSYDSFPVATVPKAQKSGDKSYYIRWGDSRVQVLERGEEFSRCRHIRTGYEMDILTKYLYTDDSETDCNDCTDYTLPLEAGDTVSIVERTSRGCLVKHGGISGWYWGEL